MGRPTLDDADTEVADAPRFAPVRIVDLAKRAPVQFDCAADGLFRMKSFTLLVGPTKAGKSVFALHCALCMASGKDIGPHKVTQKRKGLIVSFEDDENEIGKRARELADLLGVKVPGELDLEYFPQMDLAEDESTAELIALINERGYDFVIVDTLAKSHTMDENSSHGMTTVMRTYRRIIKDTGAAVIALHHTGHAANSRDISHKAMGNVKIPAEAQLILHFQNISGKKGISRVNGRGKGYPPISLDVECQEDESGNIVSLSVTTGDGKTNEIQKTLTCVADLSKDNPKGVSRQNLCDKYGESLNTWKRKLEDAASAGFLKALPGRRSDQSIYLPSPKCQDEEWG